MGLLHPKPITLKAADGSEHTFILHKFPAIPGREILCKYPLSAIPKLGDYEVNEQTMLKLMAYVAVQPTDGGIPIQLITKELINSHVPDPETLMKLESHMLEYNCSFFQKGLSSDSLKALEARARPWITKILTEISAQLSKKAAQHSKS